MIGSSTQESQEQQPAASNVAVPNTAGSSTAPSPSPLTTLYPQQPSHTTALTPHMARRLGTNYRVPRTAAEILNQTNFVPQCFHKVMPPRQYPNYEVSIWSDIGNRRTQEDRCTFCSQLIKGRTDTGFFGVFDGTVGDFASENVKHLVVPHLIGSPPWPRIVELVEAAERQGLRRSSIPQEEGEEANNIKDTKHSDLHENDVRAEQQAEAPDGGSSQTSSASMVNGTTNSKETARTTSTDAGHSNSTENSSADIQPRDSIGAPPSPTTSNEDTERRLPSVPDATSSSSPPVPVLTEQFLDSELPPLISSAMDWMYLNSDTELVQLCAEHTKHYSSSTSVTVLLIAGYCCVGHLGDSRVALGYERMGMLYGEFLTMDHKPNMPSEQDRILRSGGSVEYLHNHNNKPFIRGGDFTIRKSKGEQPMQLQYSRAFGGKDLKMFGLSNEPDLRIFKIDSRHNVLILASDGVWDVQSAAKAVEIVLVARRKGDHPALSLITSTLNEQRTKNQNADNLTAIVIFLEHGKIESKFEASSSAASPTPSSDNKTIMNKDNSGAPFYSNDSNNPPMETPTLE